MMKKLYITQVVLQSLIVNYFKKFRDIMLNGESAWRPGWLGAAPFALADPHLAAAVGPHDVNGLSPSPLRAEGQQAAIW